MFISSVCYVSIHRTGSFFLPATDIWSELLPFYGKYFIHKVSLFLFSYSCHRFLPLQEICHRDLKLENTLLDGSTTPRLKICDFGYSKVFFFTMILISMIQFPCYLFVIGSFTFLFAIQSGLLHSQPKSTVGTPAYIAPEVLSRKEYDGKV